MYSTQFAHFSRVALTVSLLIGYFEDRQLLCSSQPPKHDAQRWKNQLTVLLSCVIGIRQKDQEVFTFLETTPVILDWPN